MRINPVDTIHILWDKDRVETQTRRAEQMARQTNTKFQAHNVEPGIEYVGKQLRATDDGNRIFHIVSAKAPVSGDWITFVAADKNDAIEQAREWRAALGA